MDDDVDPLSIRLPPKFPVELRQPPGFAPDDPGTWPEVEGRTELVGGRLMYLPPCEMGQSIVVFSVAGLIGEWVHANEAFTAGTNEVGVSLGGDVRGIDVAVWPRHSLGPRWHTTAPILAVDVEGRWEGEATLRERARWYLDQGTSIVWLVLWYRREILVLTARGESHHKPGEMLPEAAELPGLRVSVDEIFGTL